MKTILTFEFDSPDEAAALLARLNPERGNRDSAEPASTNNVATEPPKRGPGRPPKTDTTAAGSPPSAAPAPSAAPSPPPAPAPAPVAAQPAGPSLDDFRAIVMKGVEVGREATVAVLAKYGAKKASEVAETSRAVASAEIKAIIDAASVAG